MSLQWEGVWGGSGGDAVDDPANTACSRSWRKLEKIPFKGSLGATPHPWGGSGGLCMG